MRNHITTTKLEVKNDRLLNELYQIIQTKKGFEICRGEEKNPLDLLIVELNGNADRELNRLERLAKRGAAKEIFLTSAHAEPELLMKAMRIGIKEFFPLPLNAADVSNALDRLHTRIRTGHGRTAEKIGQIISVFGSKGGVGTTTVAVNLAVALAAAKPSPTVALLDMNTLFGEIPLFLEISPKFHWGEITKNIDRLDDTFLMNILSKHDSGVHLLPSPAYLNGNPPPTPEIMRRLLSQMQSLFDYVVIDDGHSTDDTILKTLQMSDSVLLVSTLSLPCLSNTTKLTRTLVDLGYLSEAHIHIIINRYLRKSEISLDDAQESMERDVFWTIPNDYKTTMSAINQGKPLSVVAPKSPISKNFRELADKLLPATRESNRRWRLFAGS